MNLQRKFKAMIALQYSSILFQMLANQSQAAASGSSSKGAGGHKVKVSISVSSDVLRVAKVQDEAYKLEISQSVCPACSHRQRCQKLLVKF